jgi:hypothetical protein
LSLFLISFLLKEKVVETSIDIQQKTNISDDYTVYYKIIQEAWAFHKPNADYPNVLKKYREAFDCVSSPLAVDVLTVLKIAIEVDSVDAMFEFSEILVKKGCEYRFFEREGLEKLKTYSSKWSDLTTLIDEVQANPHKYWNAELKQKMELLYDLDLDCSKKFKGKTKYGNAWYLETKYQEEVKVPFLKLIKEYGMVGEKELGIYFQYSNDEEDLLYQPFPGIIMLHIVQSGESRFTHDEIESYYKAGYISNLMTRMIKSNDAYQNKSIYKKTNELIQRGAPEDSIIIQVREDWRANQKK